MIQKSRHGKSVLSGHSIRGATIGALNEHMAAPISAAGKSMHDEEPFHFLGKEDIEKELSKIEKKFGMP